MELGVPLESDGARLDDLEDGRDVPVRDGKVLEVLERDKGGSSRIDGGEIERLLTVLGEGRRL